MPTFLQVMIPKPGTTDKNPAPLTAVHTRASPARGASPAREKSSSTDYKILATLTALSEGMTNMRGCWAPSRAECSSALGANMRANPMTIDTLMDSPEQKRGRLPHWPCRADKRRCTSTDKLELRQPPRHHVQQKEHPQNKYTRRRNSSRR